MVPTLSILLAKQSAKVVEVVVLPQFFRASLISPTSSMSCLQSQRTRIVVLQKQWFSTQWPHNPPSVACRELAAYRLSGRLLYRLSVAPPGFAKK